MSRHYLIVAHRADYRCEYCRAPTAIFNDEFKVDHITPTSRGGDDDLANLALSCRACNKKKSNHTDGWDDTSELVVPLFHPRTDRWAHHFEFDLERGEIRGTTSVGRATVARLGLNEPTHILARLLWIELRLFP